MVKECKPGFVKNPASGRCVDKDGPTGRKLRGLKALPKFGPKPAPKQTACRVAGKVRNPRTGRCMDAMTLCHKMNGVNPSKFGNAVAAQCRNALTKKIAGVRVRVPAKADKTTMATIKRVAKVVDAIAQSSYKREEMTLTNAELRRLRSAGFKLDNAVNYDGVGGSLTKDGVTFTLTATDRSITLKVAPKGSKDGVEAVWYQSNLELDWIGEMAWPAAARLLRATLTRKLGW